MPLNEEGKCFLLPDVFDVLLFRPLQTLKRLKKIREDRLESDEGNSLGGLTFPMNQINEQLCEAAEQGSVGLFKC